MTVEWAEEMIFDCDFTSDHSLTYDDFRAAITMVRQTTVWFLVSDVYYRLSAVCSLLSALCCLQSAITYDDFRAAITMVSQTTVCCLLSNVCCLMSAACCLLSAICCLLPLAESFLIQFPMQLPPPPLNPRLGLRC
jgi:hypothetical protein